MRWIAVTSSKTRPGPPRYRLRQAVEYKLNKMRGYSYEAHVRGWALKAGITSSSYIELRIFPPLQVRYAGWNHYSTRTREALTELEQIGPAPALYPKDKFYTESLPELPQQLCWKACSKLISAIGDLKKLNVGAEWKPYWSTLHGHQWPEGFCDQAISTPVRSICCNLISPIRVPSQFHAYAEWRPIFIEGFVWPDRLYIYIVAPVASPSQLSRSPANLTPALHRSQPSWIVYGYQCPEDLRDQVAILIRETATAGLLVWFTTCWKLGHRNSPEILMIWGMLCDKRLANEGYISAEEKPVLDMD